MGDKTDQQNIQGGVNTSTQGLQSSAIPAGTFADNPPPPPLPGTVIPPSGNVTQNPYPEEKREPLGSKTRIGGEGGVASSAPQVQAATQNAGVQTQPVPQVLQQPGTGMAGAVSQSNQSSGSVVTTKTKKGSRLPKMLAGILLILLLAVGGYLLYQRFGGKSVVGGKKGELVWWGLWEDEAVYKSLIDEYEAVHPDVKITYIKQSQQDYRERLANSLAKGEGPDIFRIHNSWVPMFSQELDVLPTSVMSADDYSNIYYPVIVSDMTTSRGIVGLPLGYDAVTLYINEDLFSELQVPIPKTWDDFRETASAITLKEEGNFVRFGAAFGNTENTDHWQEIVALMMIQNGVDLGKPNDDVKLASDALAFYTLIYAKDKLWDVAQPPSTLVFANGKVGMYFAPSWRAFELNQINPGLNYRTVQVPQLPKNNADEPDYAYATYWVEGVWQASTNKKIAWDFLKFLSSRESLEKIYKNASNLRGFGQAYPRMDMADLLEDHEVLGSVVLDAPNAKSWYLVSRTFDGPSGINTAISGYFEDAVNRAKGNGVGKNVLNTLKSGIDQVLAPYNLVK